MKNWLSSLLQWALMVFISAFLFVEFFWLNEWLFSTLEHAKGVNWIFLPAGFRVLLVLTLGMPGALGIFCGNLWLDLDQLQGEHWALVLLTASASGLGPWCVKYWMETRHLLDRQLNNITAARLLNFVLIYAIVNALSHQLIRWSFDQPDSQPWLDFWPMFVGDAIGALAILYAVKFSIAGLRRLERTQP